MTTFNRNFIAGKMNKDVDARLIPDGQYIDALNIRMGSTEESDIGVIQNVVGNELSARLFYTGAIALSDDARCIGAVADSDRNILYWFVHDSNFSVGATGKLDMIVSYDFNVNLLTYIVISIDDGGGVNTTLNFNPKYLITGVNIIDDFIPFTDDYNQPRIINRNNIYPAPLLDIDQFTAESLLLIKKPPTTSPSLKLSITSTQENFLQDRFVCFAYRYKYENGEYSATSQWTKPAFVPKSFDLNPSSSLNEGMENLYNSCEITYDSGGPLVKGIDLLFKLADSNVIKVIEKLDKNRLGLNDNTSYPYQFSNSKIFTVLPDSELLRLFDNVPRLAKAQTIMGNRLMFGNYVEGYDLIDFDGFPTNLDYIVELKSKAINTEPIPDSKGNGYYTIDVPITITNSVVYIDLTDVNLIEGAAISLDITIGHSSFTKVPTTLPSPSPTGPVDLNFTFFLLRDYTSVNDLATSPEFIKAVGTALPSGNIKPVYDGAPGALTSCNGTTFTDRLNCLLPDNLDAWIKYESGINGSGEPIKIVTTAPSELIGLQMVSMRYVDNVLTPTNSVYEYYEIISAYATFQEVGTARSLHSNRGYEIGIVYMDEFNRATTALVSQNNTAYVPCESSLLQNELYVTIPITQHAPSWATRYKLVIKPDRDKYETIYSNIFFHVAATNDVWLLLVGENATKVELGDRFIVKADTSGALDSCVYATVLEKKLQGAGNVGSGSPEGVYMRMNANNFSVQLSPDAVFRRRFVDEVSNEEAAFSVGILNVESSNTNVTIPAGSVITLQFNTVRRGAGGSCVKKEYRYNKTFISQANYTNLKEWFDGDSIVTTINSTSPAPIPSSVTSVYNPALSPTPIPLDSSYYNGPTGYETLYWQFADLSVAPYLIPDAVQLLVSGFNACPGWNQPEDRKVNTQIAVTIFRAINNIIFETIPTDALPDVFFENGESFPIGVDGSHGGNIQNQNFGLGIPAIVDTKFFNCFSFGNGVESYKVRDSIIGRSFDLGNRVTTVSAQDYKETRRYADITYSGVYNNETNVNKLNEFNLGLLNFKPLENSFGPIYILDGRETDVLVLQEDKISYVLAGKNLLSDASAGGVVTTTPEVLGTQIARNEKFGISHNPESYVHWGEDRYFTDTKRGSVIQLKGGGGKSSMDQLVEISDSGMRSWFRGEFKDNLNYQKLGGFDPYMNEYVLTINDRELPGNDSCLECGIPRSVTRGPESDVVTYEFCVDLGQTVGLVNIDYIVLVGNGNPGNSIQATYNGVTTGSGNILVPLVPGSFTINKDLNFIETATIIITLNPSTVLQFTVNCPTRKLINIVEIALTNDTEAGQTIHNEWRYSNGIYTSPLQSSLVTFLPGVSVPLVSRYSMSSGLAGSPGVPYGNSIVRMQTNKYPTDTYNFEPLSDKFRWLSTNVLYGNNTVDLNALLSVANVATPNQAVGQIDYADFTMPAPTVAVGDYLYLVWDFRDTDFTYLCYADTEFEIIVDPCCNCILCETDCITIIATNTSSELEAGFNVNYGLCGVEVPVGILLDPLESITICIKNGDIPYELLFYPELGVVEIETETCGCTAPCEEPCYDLLIIGVAESSKIEFVNCIGDGSSLTVAEGEYYMLCARTGYEFNVISGEVSGGQYRCDCYGEYRCFETVVTDRDTIGPVFMTAITIDSTTHIPPSPIDATDETLMMAYINSLPGVKIAGYNYVVNSPTSFSIYIYFTDGNNFIAITINNIISYSFTSVTCNTL
jgi:hypothetical protein